MLKQGSYFLFEIGDYSRKPKARLQGSTVYVKVGERSFLYERRAFLVYVKVGENIFSHFYIYKIGSQLIFSPTFPYIMFLFSMNKMSILAIRTTFDGRS